jgi:hypothetical protein
VQVLAIISMEILLEDELPPVRDQERVEQPRLSFDDVGDQGFQVGRFQPDRLGAGRLPTIAGFLGNGIGIDRFSMRRCRSGE